MFIRDVTTSRGKKTYRYSQLVESFRKPDGTPAHRVLCSLKDLSQEAIDNLKMALKASRDGQTLVVAPGLVESLKEIAVHANYAYLDVAVAYQAFQELRLNQLLSETMSDRTADVSPAEVVAGLVVHRCIAPGSKLAAAQWYPTTALPEVQGIAPARFGNSRVHRVLTQLEEVEADLQSRLSEHLRSSQGAFISLFVDITDTWFEGRGPAMAYTAITKEGLRRKKIGLALMCDARGYPLRWVTLPGNYYEGEVMSSMVEEVAALDWVHKVPVVLDRAMGRAELLKRLAKTGVRFVSALPANEFESWTQDLPWKPFDELVLAEYNGGDQQDLARIRDAANRAKLKPVRDDRWIVDLGVVTRTDLGDIPRREQGLIAQALRTARAMQADLDSGAAKGQAELAKRYGCSERSIRNYLRLSTLASAVQHRVLAGEAETLPLQQLDRLARQPLVQQESALQTLLANAHDRMVGQRPGLGHTRPPSPGLSLRLVATFNPQAFLEQRCRALERDRELEAFVADLNRRLRSPHSRRRSEAKVLAEVEGALRRMKWVDLFDVRLTSQDAQDRQVDLVRNEEAWARRRRYDGFCVFLAHPDIPMTAAELVDLYYAKDALEKDFQTIKSELELRPIRHHSDLKVKAHITVCVLALLVERYLEQKLKNRGLPSSAQALFERLAPCHLNILQIRSGTTYTVTRLDPDQQSLLAALELLDLAVDAKVSEWIHPRRTPTL